MLSELPEPWKSFLKDLDRMVTSDVTLHCLGGFVVTACYGLPRATGDLDVLLVFPSEAQATLVALAGQKSDLHKKHGVYLDVVTVATYPENYEQRLIEVFQAHATTSACLRLTRTTWSWRNSNAISNVIATTSHTSPRRLLSICRS